MGIQSIRAAGWFLSVFLFILISSTSYAASALWIAESEGALKVATGDGAVLFEIPEAGGVEALAVDAQAGRVWTLTGRGRHQRLKAYTANGVAEVDVKVRLPRGPTPVEMVAAAGGLWLAAGRTLYRFDHTGHRVDRIRFRRSVTGLTLDTERRQLWVAVPGHVFVLDRHGNDIDRFRTYFPLIAQLDYDAALDHTWLVVGPYVLRLDAEDRDLEFVSTFGAGFKFWHHASADGQGGVWGATPTRVSHLNAEGHIDLQFQPFQGRCHGWHDRRHDRGKRDQIHKYNRSDRHKHKHDRDDGGGVHLRDLVADPSDGAVWLANRTTVQHYDNVGALQKVFTPDLGDGVIRAINRMALEGAGLAPPELQIARPQPGDFVNTNTPGVELSYTSDGTVATASIEITHNDASLDIDCTAGQQSAECVVLTPLPEGEVMLAASIADEEGNRSEPASVTFTVDTVAPVITVTNPAEGLITNNPEQLLSGTVSEPLQGLTLEHYGALISLSPAEETFETTLTLAEGANTPTLTAVDRAGNTGTAVLGVVLDTVIPTIPNLESITVSRPDADGNATITGQPGSVEPDSQVTITNPRTGEMVTVTADSEGAFIAVIVAEAGDELQIRVTDAAGNTSEAAQSEVTDLPPDPAMVAPPLAPTGITPFVEATAFLYSGASSIQTGVEPGTIQARRAAVIRGNVLDKQNNPLPGVTVSVKNHPEFGQTLSRADGAFDLAVNGGGTLILNYEKADHLPVQRKVNTPWRDYVHAEDVVMIGLDPQVTTIDLSIQTMQIAQGTAQTDEDGTRQATLLFPAGTTATMTLPDGTSQALTTLNVRATEYTVGKNGPEAMPAELPPTAGYTYAVELTVDEALERGVKVAGKDVIFDRQIPMYVDNFLEFPTGEVVPVGYYNSEAAVWVPYPNGRIVELVAIKDGLAVLDVNGQGNPATPDELDTLGIAEAELSTLAELYNQGESLWRVGLTHFSTWDWNWPYGPPRNAEPPPAGTPEVPDRDRPNDSDREDECDGCVINPQAQTIEEEIPLTGTPFSLIYRSDRVPGYKAHSQLTVPISDEAIPDSLETIVLSIEIAGRRVEESFELQTDLSYTFEWDGLDAFGREIKGGSFANINVSYIYPCVYLGGPTRFGEFSGSVEAIGVRENCRSVSFSRRWQEAMKSPLGSHVNTAGNWSLNVHHARGFPSSRLVLGDGRYRTNRSHIIRTAAGSGPTAPSGGFSGDGGLATESQMRHPRDVAVGQNNNLYIADSNNARIRHVGSDGIITTVAGAGERGFSGDGGPAIEAQMQIPNGVAVDDEGNLYFADSANNRIRRVDSEGIIVTVAGSGPTGAAAGSYAGDGGLASEARLNRPHDVAVDEVGNLFIADSFNHRIRRVGPDGIITTVAGNGERGFSGDGGPAVDAQLQVPVAVAVDASGNIYIADAGNDRIRLVTSDGAITTIAGSESDSLGDGGPAVDARLRVPSDVAVDGVGNLYIADRDHQRIRRVGPDGLIVTLAGNGMQGLSGNGGPAIRAQLDNPNGVGIDVFGNVYIADSDNNRIRWVPGGARQFAPNPGVVSRDGTEQYLFDTAGRHLRTESLMIGRNKYEFGRDMGGRLISVTDVDGRLTTIERDSDGTATAVISPDGHRTEFDVDENGHLVGVTNPAGEIYIMAYTPDGLMTEFRDRRRQISEFEYDVLGRLTRDVNAGLGGWDLARTELERGYRTTMITAEARELAFTIEPQPEGDHIQRNLRANGTVQERHFHPDGLKITVQPDGTTITVQEGPDPHFGMQAPVPEETTIETPGGLSWTTLLERTTQLTDPADPADPLSLETLAETTTVNGRIFQTTYDGATRTFIATSSEGRTVTRTINEQGRLTSTQIAGLAPVDFANDTRGRLEQISEGAGAESRVTRLSYYDQSAGAQAGYLQSITDAENRAVQFEYDAAGRVTGQTVPDGREIQYGYDANGNLMSITPPGRPAHVFNYNAFDLEDQYMPPTVDGVTQPQTVYDYNLDKQLVRITRPDGQAVNFGYNVKGQLESLITGSTGGAGTREYGYTYLPDTGQLDTVTSPDNIVLDYGYDGFLLTDVDWAGQTSGSLDISFDNDFRVTRRCVNTSSCIDFSYDSDSLVTIAGDLSISRDPQKGGLVAGTAMGGITTNRKYNSFGELETVDADANPADLYGAAYVRDNLGRITEKTETTNGATVTKTYGYDQAGRLTIVTRSGVTTTYTYDANGNRLSKTTGTDTETGTYDDQDRMLSYNGCTYSYTDNGELQSKTCGIEVTTYQYDALGNLLSVTLPDGTEVKYLIDGQNRRVGKQVDGTLVQGFLYADQLNPIAELNPDGSIKSRFIYGTKANVPDYMIRDNVAYRIVSDHLGSPRLVVNAETGEIVQRMDYDEFGRVIADTSPGFQPFGFAGGIYDTDTGLVRFGARDYNAQIGRWTTKDPIKFKGGLNFYTYVENNPQNNRDALGLETTVITVRDNGIGTHSAVHVDNGGSQMLYDPAGGYVPPSGEPRGSGDFFGDPNANLDDYIKFHEENGSEVETTTLPTSSAQDKAIMDRIIKQGGAAPFFCSVAASNTLGGVMGIPGGIFFPGNLADAAKEAASPED